MHADFKITPKFFYIKYALRRCLHHTLTNENISFIRNQLTSITENKIDIIEKIKTIIMFLEQLLPYWKD